MEDKPTSYEMDQIHIPRAHLNRPRYDTYSAPEITIERTQPRPTKNEGAPERGKWARSIESLFLCISMSVGLGNVWRFPSVAYKNGGGAFLIPYLLLLVIIGRPLYYLELILGQFSSQGPIKLWRVVPAFKGIGYAQVISVSFVVIFYNYLMALSVYYIYSSMHECLPWTECKYDANVTNFSAKHFYDNEVLELDQGVPYELTHISWKLVVCLLITWIIVYIAVVQGTDSLGKMAYFTAIFPYIVLAALLIVSLQQEGSVDGIKFFFKPDLEKLKDVQVWYRACEQSFFSLAIGFGNIVMIASYNKFTNNVYRDAIIISVTDTFTNILAGCVVFSVLGTLAKERGIGIPEVITDDELGLPFVVYPQALANIKFIPQLWSVLFFIMFFTLGIGSSMSQIETILTVLKDKFPGLRVKKGLLSLAFCAVFFGLGTTLTTNVGREIMVLLNNYGVGTAAYFYATLEIIGIMWIYGMKNFFQDAKYMLGSSPGIFWKVTWSFAAPVALATIFIYGHIPSEETNKSWFPPWADYTGTALAVFAVGQIPIWAIYVIFRSPKQGIWQKIKHAFKATEDWGPSDPVDRAGWIAFKQSSLFDSKSNGVVAVSAVYNESFQDDVF